VWKTSLTVDGLSRQMTPIIFGHGHVLGKGSEIDSDMSGVTSAAELFNYLNVTYYPGN
jgi:hypothetical protein